LGELATNQAKGCDLRGFVSRWVLGAFLFTSVLFCSCATPYKPLDHHYGYSERQVSNNVYEVSFVANGNSSYERASNFAMLRAAEIALSRKANSFAILDVVNLSSARTYRTQSHPYRTFFLYMSPADQTILPPAGPVSWTSPSYQVMDFPETRIYYRPGVKLKIRLLPNRPGSYATYDPAKEVQRIRTKYGLKSAQGDAAK
jgi:hypothetical protein